MYTVNAVTIYCHCTWYTVFWHCTLSLHTAHCHYTLPLYTVTVHYHCTLYIVHCTLYSVNCTPQRPRLSASTLTVISPRSSSHVPIIIFHCFSIPHPCGHGPLPRTCQLMQAQSIWHELSTHQPSTAFKCISAHCVPICTHPPSSLTLLRSKGLCSPSVDQRSMVRCVGQPRPQGARHEPSGIQQVQQPVADASSVLHAFRATAGGVSGFILHGCIWTAPWLGDPGLPPCALEALLRVEIIQAVESLKGIGVPPPPQGCIGRERTSEAAREAVRQVVGGGCRSGWGRLLWVTNAIEAGAWRRRQWLGEGWAPWRGGVPPFQCIPPPPPAVAPLPHHHHSEPPPAPEVAALDAK